MQCFRVVCTSVLAVTVSMAACLPDHRAGATPVAATGAAAAQPPGLAGAVLVATVAALEGDNHAAGQAFRDAARLDPSRPNLLHQAFLYSALAGDDAASQLATRLPGQAMAELVMGDDAILAGRWGEAKAHYGRAPQDAMLAMLRPLLEAWSLAGEGQVDAALSVLAPWTGANATGADSRGGYYAIHAALIAEAAGQRQRADGLYRIALALSPGHDVFTTRALGHWLVGQGRRDEAVGMADRLVAALPGLSLARGGIITSFARPPAATPRQGVAQAYFFLSALIGQQAARLADPSGRPAHDEGMRDIQMLLLRFALALDPGCGQGRLMLSSLQSDAGQPALARETIGQAAPGDPLSTLINLQQARLDAATGHLADAQQILTRLAREYPDQPQIWQMLGNLYSGRQDWNAAITAFDRAVAVSGRLAGDGWTLLFERAVAYDRSGRWPQAQADLQRALDLAPNEAMLLNYLGYSLVERGQDLPKAEALLRRAVAIAPGDAAIRDSLGWALVRQGHIADGLGLLERAAEQTPEDPAVNYHLGVAYWQSGRPREAVSQWHMAELLPAEASDAQKIHAALADAARSGHEEALGQQSGQKKD
ncbi:TPR repeat containing protein [Gluconacetobacter johannae DSM 13595]|uniref:Tetratricopeptide repeat protein n=1 Tax=Gluconacetobacter johannae TaxID=112140 RepID=A0A7W4JA84_9PROT|nr:tetratricopeptide repeat protein [Gluconacetobacter johannae]MBB2177428.1 tetratricopeptide repeat protein [Gluconacetobacter johannae]GBQ81629.1 TPR repeat containing protein [Gluconacetobacter johannae DSM 13595]